jgi:ureidoglycolate dehydrogenase (NAD+)
MKVKITEIRKLLQEAASKYVSKEEAEYFAEENIGTHLKKAPRSNAIGDIIPDLQNWKKLHKKQEMIVEKDKNATFLLDFNGLAPSMKLKWIHDELEKRAKKHGASLVGIRNSGGIHVLNLWTDGLGKRDLIGICMFNGGPDGVVPFGGTKGIFGTNPISYAIPTNNKPVIVDMATSDIPYFEIKKAKNDNKKLRKGVAVDSTGEITTDPHKALSDDGTSNLTPLGNSYKGYALVFLIEVLTGAYVNSLLSTQMDPSYVLEEHGGLLIALDISTFTDIRKFKKSVSQMCDVIRKQKPKKGVNHITVPGDRSYARLEEAKKEGLIDIEKEKYEDLKKLI